MIKAILFDFDGVLVDSEQVNIEAGIKTFKEHGMPLTDEERLYIVGRSSIDYVPHFLKARSIIDPDIHHSVIEELRRNYDTMWDGIVTLTPGVGEVLSSLKTQGKKLAIATTNRRSTIDKFFRRFGFINDFDVVVTGEDVKRRKPDPEVYTLTVKKLGITPNEGIVIEDATVGIVAVKAAGLRCIAFPNTYTKDNDFSAADDTINSLEDLLELI